MRFVELEPGTSVNPEAVEAVESPNVRHWLTYVYMSSGTRLEVTATYTEVLRKLAPDRCPSCVQDHRTPCTHLQP